MNAQAITFTDCTILPMTGPGAVIESGYVTAVDGAITAVQAGEAPVREGDTVIDGRGKVLLPGLVNAHTHLYQVLLRAVWEDLPLLAWLQRIYGVAEALHPEHVFAGTSLGCLESLKGGVTTVCEHNFLHPGPECAAAAVDAISESGLRGVFARTIMDTGEMAPDCARETPDTAFARIEELMARHRKNGAPDAHRRITFRTGPNTPPINTSPDLLREIRRFADHHSIGISAHVAESASVVEATRREFGRTGVVAHLKDFDIPGEDSIFAHCVHLSPEEIRCLADTGTAVSHNPVSNMMLGDGIAAVVEMLAAGVRVALGSDGAASNHGQDLFETMKTASLLQKVKHLDAGVIDPYTVLRMATVDGAHALGLASVCGTVEVGKRADLILVDIRKPHFQPVNDLVSQLVHCAKAADVDTVVAEGRVLMRERKCAFLDEEEILRRAQAAQRDLMHCLSAA